jgi:hypothetical protein
LGAPHRVISSLFLGIVLACATSNAGAQARAHTPTLFGFTPFPYDSTLEAARRTHDLDAANSTLWAIHYDDNVPWTQALTNAPFPPTVQQRWNDDLQAIPPDHAVYLALCPLDKDRHSLAPNADPGSAAGAEMDALKRARLDDDRIVKAYANYALRAIDQFHPRYVNLAVEAGQMLPHDLARWQEFCGFYRSLTAIIRKAHPEVKLGISFKLANLRAAGAWDAAQPVIAASDFIGLSFYPYASSFEEKFGAPPMTGPQPWKEPLDWIEAHARKPIALCETGYTTEDISIPQYKLEMHGDPALQADYVGDLFKRARSGRYLFVVWFLSIDYDALYAHLPPGSDVVKLWKNIGLLDGKLNPKPAWKIWQEGIQETRKAR